MRVNHDADRSRLVAKYGAKRLVKKPATMSARTEVSDDNRRRQWLETHREHLRWKITADYAKWRHKQFLRQGGTCYYCDEPLNGSRINDEHVMPKIAGGTNKRSNLVLACWRCNKDKGVRIIGRKKRAALAVKNKVKKGTYHKLTTEYPSEEQFALELADHFRED